MAWVNKKCDTNSISVVVGHATAFGWADTIEGESMCTVTYISIGIYNVLFHAPHPDGAKYAVVFGTEDTTDRDIPKAAVLRGSKTLNGFTFTLTEDDNGTVADPYTNKGWAFNVLKTIIVLIP